EADGGEVLAEFHGQRQADVSQSDHAEAAVAQIQFHDVSLQACAGGASSARHTVLPPLDLWMRSSMASCWRSSSASGSGIASSTPGARTATEAACARMPASRVPESSASALCPPVMARYTSTRMPASSSAPCSSRLVLSTL